MKVYWQLVCDYGHAWGGFFEEEADISMQCSEGHEAVTCSKQLPVDQVQIKITPAGRIADTITKKPTFERQVWIVVSDIQGSWEYQSQKIYSWREAEQIVRLFECCPLEKAKQIVERKQF